MRLMAQRALHRNKFGKYIACSTSTVNFFLILQSFPARSNGNKEVRETWCWTCQSKHTVEPGIVRHCLGTPVSGSKSIENCSWSL
ncbi:hypothetical protein V6N12_061695 [Hibiscus sabdariffa]|uniref:Uncharacterized protein n=1 Tax=Hibiscus sabdariffa TaxID=183260 RepID=A0ABR2DXT5_9ROSI